MGDTYTYFLSNAHLNEVDDVEESFHELGVGGAQPPHRQVHLPLKLTHGAEPWFFLYNFEISDQ